MLNKQQKNYFLQRLLEFLKIRSISADPKYQRDRALAVTFLKKELKEAGFKKIETFYSSGTVVYAEKMDTPGAPTLLIYGHYDVQPPEPLNLWKTPPFKPTIRGGKIFARGASDDKGQLYTHLAALKLMKKVLPLNIKILIEGEEESGCQNIKKLIAEKTSKFKADVCVISDTGFISKKIPSIEVSTRGIIYYEMTVTTADKDLHSGIYGGAVYNPLNIIADIVGKINTKFGTKTLRKEPLNSVYCSFDVNGIRGGFIGEGAKTVIPNTAMVKFSIRLTPEQRPEIIDKKVKKLIKEIIPRGIEVDLKVLGMGAGYITKGNSKYFKLAKQSMKKTFGKTPILVKSGGSLPIVSALAKLAPDVIFMGYGLLDDDVHSPNEKFDLDQFYGGIECNMEFYKSLTNKLK